MQPRVAMTLSLCLASLGAAAPVLRVKIPAASTTSTGYVDIPGSQLPLDLSTGGRQVPLLFQADLSPEAQLQIVRVGSTSSWAEGEGDPSSSTPQHWASFDYTSNGYTMLARLRSRTGGAVATVTNLQLIALPAVSLVENEDPLVSRVTGSGFVSKAATPVSSGPWLFFAAAQLLPKAGTNAAARMRLTDAGELAEPSPDAGPGASGVLLTPPAPRTYLGIAYRPSVTLADVLSLDVDPNPQLVSTGGGDTQVNLPRVMAMRTSDTISLAGYGEFLPRANSSTMPLLVGSTHVAMLQANQPYLVVFSGIYRSNGTRVGVTHSVGSTTVSDVVVAWPAGNQIPLTSFGLFVPGASSMDLISSLYAPGGGTVSAWNQIAFALGPFDGGIIDFYDGGASADAGTMPDAGPPDAGPPDAGPPDAGAPDAGPSDAGQPDAGPPDAGAVKDAGEPDLPRELATGCGCRSAADAWSPLLAVLAAFALRRRAGARP